MKTNENFMAQQGARIAIKDAITRLQDYNKKQNNNAQDTKTQNADFGKLAVDIHHVFNEIHPLLSRSKFLALNAEISSARQGEAGRTSSVIARDLNRLTKDLEVMVELVGDQFNTIMDHLGQWIKSSKRKGLFDDFLRRLVEEIENSRRAESNSDLETSSKTPQGEEERSILDICGAANWDCLERVIDETSVSVEQLLENISQMLKKLTGVVQQISTIAVRQSHFLAISAKIEASREELSETDLMTVAQDMKKLADDMLVIVNGSANRMAMWGNVKFTN